MRSLFRNLFRRSSVSRDLDDELESYIRMVTDEKVAAGMPEAAARRAARVEFGGLDAVKEAVHRVSAGALLRELLQDVRYAGRSFGRQPAFLCVSVLTIALGIGLNASIFSIFNSLLLKPLPGRGSNALVNLYQEVQGGRDRLWFGGQYRFSLPEYAAYRDRNQVFTGVAAYHPEMRVLFDDRSEETNGQVASCNYFGVLEAKMALGRGFAGEECTGKEAANVVVLSDTVWREQYAADASIVGRSVRMNRVPMTVIGVAAPGFAGTDMVAAGYWVPLPMMKSLGGGPRDNSDFTAEGVNWLEVIGRRGDGVTMSEVQANLAVIAQQLDKGHPGQRTTLNVAVSSLAGAPNKRQVMMGAGAVVLIAVTLVLLIACANLANLMLARASARGKEIAMRLALGASRGRLIRQLLTEALVITMAGGVLGLLFASWAGMVMVRLLLQHLPAGAPPVQLAASPDLHVVAYAFVLTLLAGVAFGLAPALHGTRADLNEVLKREGAAAVSGRKRRGGRGILVAGQVAACMVLLIASGLLIRALQRAQTVDPGFTMNGVAVLSYDLSLVGYDNDQCGVFNAALVERLRSLHNLDGVVLASGTPLGNRHFVGAWSARAGAQAEVISYLQVAPGFFSLLHIPVMRGRDFSREEASRAARAAVVSESLARSFWPGEEAVGKLLYPGDHSAAAQVVGVVRDAEVGELGDADRRFVYTLPGKADQWFMQTVMVRYQGDYTTAAGQLRAVAKGLDPSLKVEVTRLEDVLGPYQVISRMTATISGILGGLALLLAMIGLYGTVAYGVSRRTREIGVRVALGAERRDVLALIIRQAMRPVVVGVVIGMVLCAGTTRILSKLLFGVSPYDPVAFAGVALLLGAIAVTATWLPARRALRVDPVVALREN